MEMLASTCPGAIPPSMTKSVGGSPADGVVHRNVTTLPTIDDTYRPVGGCAVGGMATVNPLARAAVSPLVVISTSPDPTSAPGAIVMLAVAVVADVTTMLLTVIPLPLKLRTDAPFTQCVDSPAIEMSSVWPGAPVDGVTEEICGVATAMPMVALLLTDGSSVLRATTLRVSNNCDGEAGTDTSTVTVPTPPGASGNVDGDTAVANLAASVAVIAKLAAGPTFVISN